MINSSIDVKRSDSIIYSAQVTNTDFDIAQKGILWAI